MPDPAQIIDSTFALYARHGSDDYIGEAITQLEHMSGRATGHGRRLRR
jgi:predicted HD phosphohydrolase